MVGENKVREEKIYPNTASLTINPTLSGMGSNLGLPRRETYDEVPEMNKVIIVRFLNRQQIS